MRRQVLAAVGSVVLLSTAGAWAAGAGQQPTATHADGGGSATQRVTLRDVDGRRVGSVRLHEVDDAVRVRARLHSLPPGFHGFHVHETGVCDPEAADGPFTSAGGHFAGGDNLHGDHAGDMPSLYVDRTGRARLDFVTDRYTLADLRDADGSAVMVHAGRDNYANIPDRYTSSLSGGPGPDAETLSTGDAGDRAACGVVAGGDGSGADPGLVTVVSDDGFRETVRRIRGEIRRADDLTLVAAVNHAAAARDTGRRLPPTMLLIFGHPDAGTPLMQQARTAGIDLPQKLLVWRDGDTVNVTYNDPHAIAQRHGITGQDALLDGIAQVLRELATG